MPRIADALERESRTVDLEQGDFERLLGRRERKQRNRRIGGGAVGAVGVAVALVMGIVLARALTTDRTPADPPVQPTPAPAGLLWPQTNMEEVRQAQELADAGDPRYTWQVSPNRYYQPGQNHPIDGEFFARFFDEVIGWEDYLWTEAFAHPNGLESGDVVYVRCAPGGKNPLYPHDPEGACAPTIDDRHYEAVRISIAQLDRPDTPSGIWVVTGWEMIEPATQADPRLAEAEATALLEAFLQARIEGEGAERLGDVRDPFADVRVEVIPLLYATSTGAPYERSELELVDGPVWPSGSMRFVVRLFAEDGQTVVEQFFSLERGDTGRLRYDTGRLRLVYEGAAGPGPGPGTTENGRAVPVEYRFLDGTVTYRAPHPLKPHDRGDRLAIAGTLPDDDAPRQVLVLLADPRPIRPDCGAGPAPNDADALARSIASDPDFDATAPVEVTVGGVPALQVDVVLAPGPSGCAPFLLQHAPFGMGQRRARLYLLDLPGGSARVLAIATITDDDSFETVLEFAAPVVDSIEFHAP